MGGEPAQPGLATARILAIALPAGVTMFWIVGWVLTGGGSEGIAPDALSSEAALWILVGALVVGFAGALVFRGRAVGVSESPGRTDRELAVEEADSVQKNLVICWALLEAPALLSVVLFLLLAENLLLWVAVPAYALGVLVTFPRGEWFGEGAAAPRAHV